MPLFSHAFLHLSPESNHLSSVFSQIIGVVASQRAKEIYLKAKAKDMLDEQKNLIRLVFARLILDEGKLSWEYSKAFKILSQAVEETNSSKVEKIDDFENKTFEHRKKSDVTGQRGDLLPLRPIWLPREDSNLQPAD